MSGRNLGSQVAQRSKALHRNAKGITTDSGSFLGCATTMLLRRGYATLPPDVTLGIQAKKFNLGFIRPENLVKVPFGKLQAGCHVSFTVEW